MTPPSILSHRVQVDKARISASDQVRCFPRFSTTMAAVGWQTAFGTEFDEEWPDDPHVDASNDRG